MLSAGTPRPTSNEVSVAGVPALRLRRAAWSMRVKHQPLARQYSRPSSGSSAPTGRLDASMSVVCEATLSGVVCPATVKRLVEISHVSRLSIDRSPISRCSSCRSASTPSRPRSIHSTAPPTTRAMTARNQITPTSTNPPLASGRRMQAMPRSTVIEVQPQPGSQHTGQHEQAAFGG
ncbi:hypothetical protein D3C80_1545510 [compost metagenome]